MPLLIHFEWHSWRGLGLSHCSYGLLAIGPIYRLGRFLPINVYTDFADMLLFWKFAANVFQSFSLRSGLMTVVFIRHRIASLVDKRTTSIPGIIRYVLRVNLLQSLNTEETGKELGYTRSSIQRSDPVCTALAEARMATWHQRVVPRDTLRSLLLKLALLLRTWQRQRASTTLTQKLTSSTSSSL